MDALAWGAQMGEVTELELIVEVDIFFSFFHSFSV